MYISLLLDRYARKAQCVLDLAKGTRQLWLKVPKYFQRVATLYGERLVSIDTNLST